ncbi:MAG: TetR/AcrR family transcriptional regulator [Anaerolineae bacterium]
MSDSIQQQLTNARRDQIIGAAIQVISEKGFQKTTVRQIAQAAGIADGTIYNYFKNKDDILMAIVGKLTEAEVREVHFGEAEQIDFDTFIEEYFTHRAMEVEAGLAGMRVIFSETMVNEKLARLVFDQVYGPAFEVAEKYFAHQMEIGRIPKSDPTIVGRLMTAPLMGLLTLRLLGDEHVAEHWAEHVKAMVELLKAAYRQD